MTESAPAEPSTAALVAAYGQRFDAQVLAGDHGVASGLGAWLLLALVAPLTTGADRVALESLLGTSADDAAVRSGALVADPPAAVAAALAAWHRPGWVTDAYDRWVGAWPVATDRRPVPTQAEADAWADEHTFGMIPTFPGDVADPAVVLVLASALATRADWREPFDVAPSARLASPWSDQVAEVLVAPRPHTRLLVRTPAAGLVGVHAAPTTQGLVVVSVVADAAVASARVQAAAYDVVALITRGSTTAERVSLFDLALGEGPAWTITEESTPSTVPEDVSVVIPAWTARSDHDLVGPGRHLGFELADRGLDVVVEGGPGAVAARQAAYAAFTRTRFEAAAVTTMIRQVSARLPQAQPRRAEVRFGHPYAVVAFVADPGLHQVHPDEPPPPEAWRGVPVFSAWVTEPSEPAELEPGEEVAASPSPGRAGTAGAPPPSS